MDISSFRKVSVEQFYGIEYEEFPCQIAQVGMWLADHQMNLRLEELGIYHVDLPLGKGATIVHGNALRLDWDDVVPKSELSYILGNPPFKGFKVQTTEQRDDMQFVSNKQIKSIGLLDYVCGWYIKAAQYIRGTHIKCAFVSTNSIAQGEQPGILWEYLFSLNIEIDFGYRTFVWTNEAKGKAQVHCVILGFSDMSLRKVKTIYDEDASQIVKNISPYLIDCDNILVQSQRNPICDVPKMIAGNKTVKCLALIMNQDEKDSFIQKEPNAEKFIKKMIGAEEFINNIPRYCLWLVNASPAELKKMPLVMERVERVRQDRLNSADKQAHILANSPTTFRDTNNPKQALVVPLVSSERRKYIPIGYIDDSTIANNKVSIIPNGTLYQFGVLTSNVHNAWMRCVAMRMKSDYSYSLSMVYNTFPWPNATEEQKKQIEKLAQGVLDSRASYPDSSLADLYDPLLMPSDLQKAHRALDSAVMKLYGFPVKKDFTEADCVAALMEIYHNLTGEMNV